MKRKMIRSIESIFMRGHFTVGEKYIPHSLPRFSFPYIIRLPSYDKFCHLIMLDTIYLMFVYDEEPV